VQTDNSLISVVLPTYNERENIERFITTILETVNRNVEIVVVDDDSPDGTWEVVERIQARNGNVRLMRRVGKRGLASAILDGITWSKGEIVVWMDCDFSHPPSLIPELIRALEHYDIALASRYVRGGSDRRDFTRVLTSRLINLFAGIFLGFSVKDYTTGFVAIRRGAFNKVRFSPKGHGEYCIKLLYRAKEKRLRLREVPFSFCPRKAGETKTAQNLTTLVKHGIAYCLTVLKLRLPRKADPL